MYSTLKPTRRYYPEHQHRHLHCPENIRSQIMLLLSISISVELLLIVTLCLRVCYPRPWVFDGWDCEGCCWPPPVTLHVDSLVRGRRRFFHWPFFKPWSYLLLRPLLYIYWEKSLPRWEASKTKKKTVVLVIYKLGGCKGRQGILLYSWSSTGKWAKDNTGSNWASHCQ
jgi:hypothetical protein